jgi:hypothetical protein
MPNWWDHVVAWYFNRRWKKHFMRDPRLLAIHILQYDRTPIPTREEVEDDYFYEDGR